ncbi:MAG: 7-cyano-7-deazaguanine synthase QueC [Hyphomicrobiaceae bacterium]|nr:7-cyano-7-deazaguanine synthase QueC [Hyphomicrobiaceae bacterium]
MDAVTTTALVLFSGGQDSTVALAWALDRFERVETIGFDYGQRHRVELEARGRVRAGLVAAFPLWASRLGPDQLLRLDTFGQISDTAMTRDVAIEVDASGLPTTFVPGRNLLFFTYAAAIAYRRGLGTLVGGMCETDYSGYPDCRNDTLQTLGKALSLGLARELVVATPLMWIDKAGTWAMAEALGGRALVDLVTEETHTCYLGDRTHRYDWGYGCDACPACDLRRTGWVKWQFNEQN